MSKIMIQAVDDLAEGVYMASGVTLEPSASFGEATARYTNSPNSYYPVFQMTVEAQNESSETVMDAWFNLSFSVNAKINDAAGAVETRGDGSMQISLRYTNLWCAAGGTVSHYMAFEPVNVEDLAVFNVVDVTVTTA